MLFGAGALAGPPPGTLQPVREVQFEGRKVQQYVGEARVTLTRPAKLQRHGRRGPRTVLRAKPLTLRLVVSELRNAQARCWPVGSC